MSSGFWPGKLNCDHCVRKPSRQPAATTLTESPRPAVPQPPKFQSPLSFPQPVADRSVRSLSHQSPPTSGVPEQDCTCPPPVPQYAPPEKQTARLNVEKRKKGKMVTVIRGLSAAGNDLPTLLTRLKDRCGAGGTVKEDSLEIQGDHRMRIRDALTEIGYRVRG